MLNFGTCVWRTATQWRLPEKKRVSTQEKSEFVHCAAVLQTQVPKLCTDLDQCLLYILILGTYSKFTRKNNFLALGACFPPDLLEPQVCRVKITFTNLPTNRFVCTTKISMKSVVKWILLRVRVRSRNTQPLLKGPCPQSDLKINEN